VLADSNHTRLTLPAFKLADPNKIHLLYYGETARIRDGYIHLERSGKRF
jgi:hypothetical protein